MKLTLIIASTMVAVIVFNLFIYAPPGMKWLGRMDMFLEGLLSGQIVTGYEDEKVGDLIDDWVGTSPQPTEATSPETVPSETVPSETIPSETIPSETIPSETIPSETEGVEITNRGTLFKIAIKEFLKSPITGMGPGGYSVKYEMFPHNVILELFAETGILGAIVLLGLALIAVGRIFMVALKDRSVMYLMVFLGTYAIQSNCNGSLWFCSALLCALGYGLTIRIDDKALPIEK